MSLNALVGVMWLALIVASAPAGAQPVGNEVFGSDDFWSRNDERAPQCGGLNDTDRNMTRQMYESRDPKANQQMARERAPIRKELLQCVAQALSETPPEADPKPLRVSGTVEKMTASINAFFSKVFKDHGRPYEKTEVQSTPELAHREEGGKVLEGEPARYNTGTGKVEYSPDYMQVIDDLFSKYEMAVTLAHEVGHHVQLSTNQRFVATKKKEWELQADVLSGAYMASMFKRPLLPNDEAELLRYYQIVGDDAAGHGTPEERLAAFRDGYRNGVPGTLFAP